MSRKPRKPRRARRNMAVKYKGEEYATWASTPASVQGQIEAEDKPFRYKYRSASGGGITFKQAKVIGMSVGNMKSYCPSVEGLASHQEALQALGLGREQASAVIDALVKADVARFHRGMPWTAKSGAKAAQILSSVGGITCSVKKNPRSHPRALQNARAGHYKGPRGGGGGDYGSKQQSQMGKTARGMPARIHRLAEKGTRRQGKEAIHEAFREIDEAFREIDEERLASYDKLSETKLFEIIIGERDGDARMAKTALKGRGWKGREIDKAIQRDADRDYYGSDSWYYDVGRHTARRNSGNSGVPAVVKQRIERNAKLKKGFEMEALSWKGGELQAHAGSNKFDQWTMETLGIWDPYAEGYVILEAIEEELEKALAGTGYYGERTGYDSWSIAK